MSKPNLDGYDRTVLAQFESRMGSVRTFSQYQEFLVSSGYYNPESRTVAADRPIVKFREKSGLEGREDCGGVESSCVARANDLAEQGKNAWVEWVPHGYTYAEAVWLSRSDGDSDLPRQSDIHRYVPQAPKPNLEFAILTPDGAGFPITAEERDAYLAAFDNGVSSATIRGHTFDRVYRIVPHDEWVMLENDRRMDRERRS